MARTKLTVKASKSLEVAIDWFLQNQFSVAEFDNGIFTLTTGWSFGRGTQGKIFNELHEHPGYTTLYKESIGGALLVFEIRVDGDQMQLECYTPVLIFGIFSKELKFKKKANWLFRCLQKGYNVLTKFKQFVAVG